MKRANIQGYLMVILSAILYGLMPLESHFVSQDGVDALTVSAFRSFMATPVFLTAFLLRRERFVPRKGQWSSMGLAAVLGYILTPVLLMSSYAFIDTGIATTLHFIYPALVVAGCGVFLREKLRCTQLGCIALCLLGVFLFYQPGGESHSVSGLLIALASGAVYAAYIVMLSSRRLRDIPVLAQSFYFSLISATVFMALWLLGIEYHLPTQARNWVIFLIMIVSTGVVANFLFQAGVKRIGSSGASILSTFEPLTSILVGVAAFQENFGLRAVLGCAAILASVVLLTLLEKKESPCS